MKILRTALILALFSCLLTGAGALAADALKIDVSPKTIDVDATYNGATLTVTGEIPAESDALVRFVGESSDLHMKEKGKAFGLLWMNMGSITIKGVPSVCIVSCEKDPKELKNIGGDGQSAAAGLRLVGLKSGAKVEAAESEGTLAVDELIKLKEKEGLYREITGNVTYTAGTNGKKAFRAEIPVPSRLSQGKYNVQVFAVKDGNVVASTEQPISATLVGVPALLANLAFQNGALYGILATIIAILSGLAIGLVFQSKGAH